MNGNASEQPTEIAFGMVTGTDEDLLFDPDVIPGGDDLVYHYTSWPTARDFILGGGQSIRLGPISHLNDPFEQESLPTGVNFDDYETHENPTALTRPAFSGLASSLRSDPRLFCTSKDQPSVYFPYTGNRVSFRRGFDHPPMWAHYAANGEGVALIFSKQKLEAEIQALADQRGLIWLSDEVDYQSIRSLHSPNLDLSYVQPSDDIESRVRNWVQTTGRHLLFSKDVDWSYENEYRWIVVDPSESQLFVPVASSIVGVVAGADFDPDNNNEAKRLCEDLRIPIRRLTWSRGSAQRCYPLEEFVGDRPNYIRFEKQASERRARRRTRKPPCSALAAVRRIWMHLAAVRSLRRERSTAATQIERSVNHDAH